MDSMRCFLPLNIYLRKIFSSVWKDTGHYNLALLKFLLDRNYQVALINPVATNLTRKMQGGISKNDKLDTLTICDVLSSNQRVKSYRISKYSSFDLYEQ
ncbi:IS110 family transposase, partial [Erysipelotrichaceae bacterium 7770_A6]|nr:IS110 family transposase [Erysipelotrichaceae bacterium 7770_A6]